MARVDADPGAGVIHLVGDQPLRARKTSPSHVGDVLDQERVVRGHGDQVGGGARLGPDGSAADPSGDPRICVHVPLRRFFLLPAFFAAVTAFADFFARNERMASRLYPTTVKASRSFVFVRPNTRKNLSQRPGQVADATVPEQYGYGKRVDRARPLNDCGWMVFELVRRDSAVAARVNVSRRTRGAASPSPSRRSGRRAWRTFRCLGRRARAPGGCDRAPGRHAVPPSERSLSTEAPLLSSDGSCGCGPDRASSSHGDTSSRRWPSGTPIV